MDGRSGAGLMCKILAWLSLAGGFIAGLAIDDLRALCIIGGIFGFVLLFAFGEIVDQLTALNNNVRELYKVVSYIEKGGNSPQEQSGQPSAAAPTGTPTAAPAPAPVYSPAQKDVGWVCPKCGKVNPAGSMSCRECGAYR